ncbi:MAG: quinone oxidoreductase family protein, partial [Acidimicrobiales bacterium]
MVDRLGGHPSLRDVADPVITAGGTSLVRVHAAVVSHLDVQIYGGDVNIVPTMPLVPGTEASGEVVDGDGFPVGTPVRVRGGGVGIRCPGAWAELVVVPESALTVLEQPVDWTLAAAYFSPAATAWAAVHDVARVTSGERLLVTGAAGAVGSMAVQLAARHGCEVVALVGSAARRDRVPAGAAAVVAFDEWDASGDAAGHVDA